LRLPFSGLRAGILTQLIFLIIAAMLLINMAMVKFSERDLLQAKVNTGRLLIYALEQHIRHLLVDKKSPLEKLESDPRFKRRVTQLLDGGGFSEVVIIDRTGNPVFSAGYASDDKENILSNTREAMETRMFSTDFSGSTWGVLWYNKKNIMISAPLSLEVRPLGGVSISSSLIPLYQTLRNSEKVIFLYIILDTLILATAGIYLLSRIAVKPIHKLLKMTEEYKEGDFVPSLEETSKNEIGELSRSLSIMLKRLDDNKKELKAHITSLEKANVELQQAQDEVIRSEKLASVGRLAAGIAHEIGNPIGIVLGYLGIIKKGDIKDEEKEDFLDRIESEITRINLIIRQLLDFSRPSSGKPEKTSAHELIMNTVNMLKPQPMMENISITFALEAAGDTVFADPNQLQQVFLNIIMNAADFLTGKSLLKEGSSKKEIILQSKNADEYIELRFVDNGPGIPEEERDHIFDPFYTTKEPGKGTGLGLAVCYRIVEGLGGTIRIESEIGKGTTIIIQLPNYGVEKG
jgi:signal transduction histidine kinase